MVFLVMCILTYRVGRAFLRSKFFYLFDLIKFLQKYIMCRKSKRIWEGEKHPLFFMKFFHKMHIKVWSCQFLGCNFLAYLI